MTNVAQLKPNATDESSMRPELAIFFQGIRTEFTRWSPETAALVLAEACYPGQNRHLVPPGPQHIEVLSEMMRREGLWREYDKIDLARLPDGRLVLVNGHHRLAAQAKAKVDIDWAVVVHNVENMERAAKLYHDFDTNTRLRSQAQILNAENVASQLGVSKGVAKSAFNAVPLIAARLDTSKEKRDILTENIFGLRRAVLDEYAEAIKLFNSSIKPADRSLKDKLFTQGATAVALVTLRYQPRRAESFWSLLAENDGLKQGHPCHTYIKTVMANKGGNTAWLSAAWAANAWNAYCLDERPTYYRPGQPKPIKLIGTPFERGR
jgi:hypothetical protein